MQSVSVSVSGKVGFRDGTLKTLRTDLIESTKRRSAEGRAVRRWPLLIFDLEQVGTSKSLCCFSPQ